MKKTTIIYTVESFGEKLRKIDETLLKNIIVILISLLAISCTNSRNRPFPKDDHENEAPVSRPLKFSEAQPLNYKIISKDSIRPPRSVHFDIDKLPTKPFAINDFKILSHPAQTKKLDWDNIPDSLINLDTIAAKPFLMTQTILPKPVITKAGIPKLLPGTTSGILQFGEEEGLPGSNITASLVDRHGIIWLATDKGLCRYTGEQLYTYKFLGRQFTGVFHIITRMVEDHTGQIWLVTSGDGIYKIDVDKEILWHDKIQFTGIGLDIICDHSDKIWISGYEDGLYIIDIVKSSIKKIQWPAQTQVANFTFALKEDKDHNIWIGNRKQISIIDPSRIRIKKIGKGQGFNTSTGTDFFEDTNGDMWIGSLAYGINCISIKNRLLITYDAINGYIGRGIKYAQDQAGQLWLMQNDSIFVFNKQKTAVKTIVTNANIGNGAFPVAFTDPHGNIWVGSSDKGAIIIDPVGPLPENLNTKNGLADNDVWSLLEDKNGHTWLGTYNGINIYDPKERTIRFIGKDQGLPASFTRIINKLDEENIFVGELVGYSIINLQKKTLTNYGKEQGMSDLCLYGFKDNTNNIWISGRGGLRIYNTMTNSVKTINKSGGLLSNTVWSIADDKHGNYWAATDNGIMVIDCTSNTIKYLREKEGLCSNTVWEIGMINNRELWIGTAKGISIVDTYKNTITNITSKEGLIPESIFSTVERDGKIYAGSENGVIVISRPDTTQGAMNKDNKWNFVNYGKREGFPFNDYNQNTILATKNRQVWLGVTPMLSIITQIPAADTAAANVYITGISIMDQPSSWSNNAPPFNIPVRLELPFDQNSINFSYSNNNIKGRVKIAYRYILEGADTEWSDVTSKPLTKNYYNLSPGKYKFRVYSKGFNGVWSKPAEMSFTILPPWWKTWWAYFIYSLLFIASVFTLNHYLKQRVVRIERAKAQKKELAHAKEIEEAYKELQATQSQLIQSEKMASLGELTAGIAHEIQNPLNFVNNFSDVNTELIDELEQEMNKGNYDEVKTIAKDIKENERKINHHGKRADAIVKGMLQHSRSSTGIKEPANINALADEYFRLAYHGLRAKDKSFNATMKTDFDKSIGNINILPQDIGRVILNLINNAFYAVTEKMNTHGNGYEPTVWVSTKKSGEKVMISVKDNGNGIPPKALDKIFQPFYTTKPAGKGTGLGLSMSYEIITKVHGGEIKVDTHEGEGAEFTIILPILN